MELTKNLKVLHYLIELEYIYSNIDLSEYKPMLWNSAGVDVSNLDTDITQLNLLIKELVKKEIITEATLGEVHYDI